MKRGPALLVPILLLAAACSRAPAPAPAPATAPAVADVRATLSTNSIRIGDLVTLDLQVAHPVGTRVELPSLARGRQIVVRNTQALTNRTDTTGSSDFRITLTSLEVGDHVLSTNAIQVIGTNGPALTAPFPFLALSVQSSLTSSNMPPREMKAGLARWPVPTPYWLLAVLGTIALLALLIGLAVAYWRRRAQAPPTPPILPPPHEVALAALRALQAKGWIESGNTEPFYVDLSGIVRRYLESRFELHAPERTTEEFIREVSTSRTLRQDHQSLVVDFLTQCDLVKFARHQPGADDMRNAMAAAERLVQETIPVIAAPGPIAAEGAAP